MNKIEYRSLILCFVFGLISFAVMAYGSYHIYHHIKGYEIALDNKEEALVGIKNNLIMLNRIHATLILNTHDDNYFLDKLDQDEINALISQLRPNAKSNSNRDLRRSLARLKQNLDELETLQAPPRSREFDNFIKENILRHTLAINESLQKEDVSIRQDRADLQKTFFVHLRQHFIILSACGLFLTALFLLCFLYHRHKIFIPINNITRSLKTNNHEQLDRLSEISQRPDEIGLLAKATYNIAELQKQNRRANYDLSQLNLSLEQKVLERTKAIEAAKKEAENANQAKNRFLNSISHIIRSPLNGILGLSDLLLSTKIADKQKSYVETIQKSGQDLLEIVNEIMDFSKLEAGDVLIDNRKFDVIRHCRTLIDSFKKRAGQKNIQIHFMNKCAKEELYIYSDPQRLRQILVNLLNNAIKFTPENGHISLITELDQDGAAIIHIQDSGIGIDEERLEHIFDEFVKHEGDLFTGTGLGLAINKKLSALLNYEISVSSQLGEGSTFSVHLQNIDTKENTHKRTLKPKNKQEEAGALQHNEEQDSFSPKVLLVEDNPTNQLFGEAALEKLGCRVQIAEHGQLALDMILENDDYDIILMDCQMPVMDGYEATKNLREMMRNGSIKAIPIVAQTANAMAGDREKCLAAGMDDYMAKPLTKELIQEKVFYWSRLNYTVQD